MYQALFYVLGIELPIKTDKNPHLIELPFLGGGERVVTDHKNNYNTQVNNILESYKCYIKNNRAIC